LPINNFAQSIVMAESFGLNFAIRMNAFGFLKLSNEPAKGFYSIMIELMK